MNPDTLEVIARMRSAGKSYTQIAARTGRSKSSVYWHCLVNCIEPPGGRKRIDYSDYWPVWRGNHLLRRFSPEEDRCLIAMRLAGATVTAIARALGRNTSSIYGRLMTLAAREE